MCVAWSPYIKKLHIFCVYSTLLVMCLNNYEQRISMGFEPTTFRLPFHPAWD